MALPTNDSLLSFSFAAQRSDLEQGVFAEDQVRLKQWTISAGVRWDHYQWLLNKESFSPRFSLSGYFPSTNLVSISLTTAFSRHHLFRIFCSQSRPRSNPWIPPLFCDCLCSPP